MIDELKPCPFCGHDKPCLSRGYRPEFVWCPNCDFRGPSGRTGAQSEAIEAWNTRKPTWHPISTAVDGKLILVSFDRPDGKTNVKLTRKPSIEFEYGATHWMPVPTAPGVNDE